jgi:RNA polymerase sigma-70 factor (ECF subfamily)
MLQIVRDLPGFKGGKRDFRAWAFTIAHHRLLDDRRSRRRRPEVPARAGELGAGGPQGDAEAEALESLRTREIRRLIDGLSPDQREVLLLRIVGGLNAEEVAAATGRGAWAVRALQRRGLLALRKKIALQAIQL